MRNNIFKDGTALLIALTLTVCMTLGMVATMIHLHISLVDAVNQLETCKADGLIDCHIERDGLDYNVYGRE